MSELDGGRLWRTELSGRRFVSAWKYVVLYCNIVKFDPHVMQVIQQESGTMPQIQLLHGRVQSVDLALLLAVCDELGEQWRDHALGEQPMPVYGSDEALSRRLSRNPEYAYSFDVACRLVSSRPDTRQTSAEFFAHACNAHWLQRVEAPYGLKLKSGMRKEVSCVLFSPACMAYWSGLPMELRQALAEQAQRLIASDIDAGGTDAGHIVTMEPADPLAVAARSSTLEVPAGGALDRRQLLQLLIADIGQTPFQPRYRRHNAGAPVTGWDKRLQAYFWPHPKADYATSAARVQLLVDEATRLALCLEAGREWDRQQQEAALALADRIFDWGGVPQKDGTVTAAAIAAVFRAALAANGKAAAPMNSGWTKVAAFATAHREGAEGGGHAQVIWDSRVATSLTSRLDQLLSANGQSVPGMLFPGLGTVGGRGGSRPRPLLLQWPGGYGKWSAQVAGSALIHDICALLNAGKHPAMPLPHGGTGPWTTRGVEMVLFMDGY